MQEKNSAVPSETHAVLFHRLRDITTRIKTAVDDNTLDTLPGLIQAHKEVMTALKAAGFSNDPGLLGLVTEIHDRVQSAGTGIQARHDELGQQLKASGTKRKLQRAYGVR
ncbi:MAG: hypothetical protein V2B19_29530 [Pseudomonadota bacterium]